MENNMKYISIILMSLFLVGNANADTRTIEIIDKDDFNVVVKKRGGGASLICIDGYKFVYTILIGTFGNTATMTQFFEERDGKSLPAKC